MTVLFTDIVDSTARASAMGDRAWRALLERHDTAAEQAVERHRGTLVKRTGDGLLATFDGPGRGIRAARELQEMVRPLDIEVRAGLHTGEVERRPATSPASACTSARGSARWPARARCSSRTPSRIS